MLSRWAPWYGLSAEIHDLEDGAIAARAQAQGHPDSILAVVDRVSIDLVRQLATEESASGLRNAESITTSSLDALRAYLEGERLLRVGDIDAAADAYERAIRADSTFALAYWGLATAQGWYGDSVANAASDSTFARLVQLSNRLPDRTRMFVEGDSLRRAGDFRSIQLFESAVARYPDDPEAWYMLGESRFHQGNDAGVVLRHRIEPFLRAISLEPGQGTYYYHPIPSLIALLDTLGADTLTAQFLAHTADTARAQAWQSARAMLSPPTATDSALLAAELRKITPLAAREALMTASFNMPYPAAALAIASAATRLDVAPLYFGGVRIVGRIQQGQLRSALTEATSGRYPPFIAPVIAWTARRMGVQVENSERYLSPSYLDGATAFWSGLDAWAHKDQARLRTAMSQISNDATEAKEPRLARELAFRRDALRALTYGATEQTRAAAADSLAALLQRAKRQTDVRLGMEKQFLREILAELYVDSKRPREALALLEPYVGARPSPLSALSLARAHELLGNRERAAAYYAIFLEGWKNADSDIRLLADAHRALERLRRDAR